MGQLATYSRRQHGSRKVKELRGAGQQPHERSIWAGQRIRYEEGQFPSRNSENRRNRRDIHHEREGGIMGEDAIGYGAGGARRVSLDGRAGGHRLHGGEDEQREDHTPRPKKSVPTIGRRRM